MSPPPTRRSRSSSRGRLRAGRGPLLAVVLAVACLAPVRAEATWRCGSRLVAIGDSASRVLSRCGAPSHRSVATELVTVPVGIAEVTRIVDVETWTYDRGPHEFVRRLVFRDGFLEWIAEDGYGG
jgi:hypothetical protein